MGETYFSKGTHKSFRSEFETEGGGTRKSVETAEDPTCPQILFATSRIIHYQLYVDPPTTQNVSLRNMSDIELSNSFKSKPDGAAGLPIYDFLLVFNSNKWTISAPLRDI